MGRSALECGIGIAIITHTVYDFSSLTIFLNHAINSIGIVL